MAVITLEQLKAKFETGDLPTGADFVDLIDTLSYLESQTSGANEKGLFPLTDGAGGLSLDYGNLGIPVGSGYEYETIYDAAAALPGESFYIVGTVVEPAADLDNACLVVLPPGSIWQTDGDSDTFVNAEILVYSLGGLLKGNKEGWQTKSSAVFTLFNIADLSNAFSKEWSTSHDGVIYLCNCFEGSGEINLGGAGILHVYNSKIDVDIKDPAEAYINNSQVKSVNSIGNLGGSSVVEFINSKTINFGIHTSTNVLLIIENSDIVSATQNGLHAVNGTTLVSGSRIVNTNLWTTHAPSLGLRWNNAIVDFPAYNCVIKNGTFGITFEAGNTSNYIVV